MRVLPATLTVTVALILSMWTVILSITLPVATDTAVSTRTLTLVTLKLVGWTQAFICTNKTNDGNSTHQFSNNNSSDVGVTNQTLVF